MGVFSALKNILRDSNTREYIWYYYLSRFVSDKLYLQVQYKIKTGKKLNLKNPKFFSEKIQWLKLYDRNPEYSKLADKYEVRKHISEVIGKDYLIPLLGVWDRFEDIDFSSLPEKFVLKCTHDSKSVIFCADKVSFDIAKAKEKINTRLGKSLYNSNKEWCYRNIIPRIICEEYKTDESGVELKDYKVFCFNGTPMYIQVDFSRFASHKRNMYDLDWQPFLMESHYPTDWAVKIGKPTRLQEMLDIASKLSVGISFLRVDFYIADERLYIGELTFYPQSGYMIFSPPEYNEVFGDLVKLPTKRKA